MKYATLTRGRSSDEGTFGLIALQGGIELHSLELPWRENATGISSIKPGTYRCEIVNSPRFGKVYGLRDVPGRSNILIHAANWAGDKSKGWHSQLQGCIAPAMDVGVLVNPLGHSQRAALQSKAALAQLMAWAGGLPFVLEIR